MFAHKRIRVQNGKVEEAPLDYWKYTKGQGWTDIRIAEIPLDAITDAAYIYDNDESVVSIGRDQQQHGKVIAFNASYVNTKSGTILGKTVDQGQVIFPDIAGKTEKRKHLYFDGDMFHIGELGAGAIFAAQGAPQLTRNGKPYLDESLAEDHLQSDITSGTNNRIVAGVKSGVRDNDALVIIMVDGRGMFDRGMTLRELEIMALHYRLADSINLDGGGSATLFTNIPVLQDSLDMNDDYHLSDMAAFYPRDVCHAVVLYINESKLFPAPPKPDPGKRIVEVTFGSKSALINGQPKQLLVAPRVIDGRTMMSLRDLADLFGASLVLNGDKVTLTIDK